MRTEPPVSVPRARSARPAATAAADSRRGATGHPPGCVDVARRPVVDVRAGQREGQFVGDRLADDAGPTVEQAGDRGRVGVGRGVPLGERRVACAGDRAGDVEHVLHRQAGPVERSADPPGGEQARWSDERTDVVTRHGDHRLSTVRRFGFLGISATRTTSRRACVSDREGRPVPQAGIEPAAYRLGGGRSIH